MKCVVSIAVEGRVDIEVDVDSIDDAQEAALEEFASANLNSMDVVSFHAVNVESETGEFRDY